MKFHHNAISGVPKLYSDKTYCFIGGWWKTVFLVNLYCYRDYRSKDQFNGIFNRWYIALRKCQNDHGVSLPNTPWIHACQ